MLERVRRLVLKSRVRREFRPIERTGFVVLLRLATDQEDGLALDVDVGIIVVVELEVGILGRDSVTGENYRNVIDRAAAPKREGHEVGLIRSFEAVPSRAFHRKRGIRTELGPSGDRERLKITIGARRRLESGSPEYIGDVIRGGFNPFCPRCPPVAGVGRQEAHISFQTLLDSRERSADGALGVGASSALDECQWPKSNAPEIANPAKTIHFA